MWKHKWILDSLCWDLGYIIWHKKWLCLNGIHLISFDFHGSVKLLQKMPVHKLDLYSYPYPPDNFLQRFCFLQKVRFRLRSANTAFLQYFFFSSTADSFQTANTEGTDRSETYLHPSWSVTASFATACNS